jgi:hypothetical protein
MLFYDKIIFVLRKKDIQITCLHVYYHITMIVCAWIVVQYAAGGQCKIF